MTLDTYKSVSYHLLCVPVLHEYVKNNNNKTPASFIYIVTLGQVEAGIPKEEGVRLKAKPGR